MHTTEFTWIWGNSPPPDIDKPAGLRAQLQFRHRMLEVPCTVRRAVTTDSPDLSPSKGVSSSASVGPLDNGALVITPDEPQKAVAPGQVAALWVDGACLGCGVINTAS
jgi:hypothetical protein